MNRIFSFLAGAICGGIVGAAVALLFAPMSGDELREQARGRVEEARIEAQRAAAERRAQLEHELARLKKAEETRTSGA